MDRFAFHRLFRTPGPIVTPVIHALDDRQVGRNVERAIRAGAAGVFLINHDFEPERLIPIIRAVRRRHPGLWLGVNFLAVTGVDAFPVLGELEGDGCPVDAYWADDARIDERESDQREADRIAEVRVASGWSGLYFGGVAFKKQRAVEAARHADAARIAVDYMDAVTTSGIATGEEADTAKIEDFRRGLVNAPLALASGVTPDNAHRYTADVDCFLVATGVSPPGDFYNIDPARLDALLAVTREAGARS